MRPVTRNPLVTAGLKCAPEIPPNAFTPTDSARPCASAMATTPEFKPTAGVLQRMAAMPAKQRKNVPRNSARQGLKVFMRPQASSNRSRFMTLFHAATKSRTNFSFASSLA